MGRLTHRAVTLLAWLVWALCLALLALTVLLTYNYYSSSLAGYTGGDLYKVYAVQLVA